MYATLNKSRDSDIEVLAARIADGIDVNELDKVCIHTENNQLCMMPFMYVQFMYVYVCLFLSHLNTGQ